MPCGKPRNTLRKCTQGRHKPDRSEAFTLKDFKYDEAQDSYRCPKGATLKLNARRDKIGGTYFRRYRAQEQDCTGCPFRSKCLEGPNTKRKHLAVACEGEQESFHRAMMKKIDTEEGRRKYGHRLAIVEPVYANLRIHKRLDRFTLRGKIKVNIQWLLYCMVHNIEKVVNYGYT